MSNRITIHSRFVKRSNHYVIHHKSYKYDFIVTDSHIQDLNSSILFLFDSNSSGLYPCIQSLITV